MEEKELVCLDGITFDGVQYICCLPEDHQMPHQTRDKKHIWFRF